MISKSILAVVVVGSSIVSSYAECFNKCNGHGTCGAWDKCACYHSYANPEAKDCSTKVCPYEKSIRQVLSGSHETTECSNQGTCNRKTGECECHAGFEGSACQRLSCSNDCSGNGECLTLGVFDTTYTGWDKDYVQTCKCDGGFTGADCAERLCPLGDDPLTLQVAYTNGNQVDAIQKCEFKDSGTNAVTGYFTLTYTTWDNTQYETRAINVATATPLEIQEALVALPNNEIPSITVTSTGTAAGGTLEFQITFDSTDNTGPIPALVVNAADYSAAGHQPKRAAVTSSGTTTAACSTTTIGTEENGVCSGRGSCDSSTGICTCHSGFTGVACSTQSVLL
mmetsp:Transcript_19197/g.31963  ORF Transcript_19197/g.31963 Transcript_19197/m.31963 type:complete len:339 (-) Transcript_19197:2336-3352(-)